jgi:hypothetical protein
VGSNNQKDKLNFEVQSRYDLEYAVQNKGDPPLMSAAGKMVLIVTNINERPILNSTTILAREACDPWALELYANTERCVIAEDTTFATIVAYDEDFNQQRFYFLAPSVDNQTLFGVKSSGQFYLKRDVLDFESQTSYEISVTAEDNGTPQRLSDDAIMFVTVLDVNERPRIKSGQRYMINEDAVKAHVSPHIDCFDPDKNDNDLLEHTVVHGKSNGSACLFHCNR